MSEQQNRSVYIVGYGLDTYFKGVTLDQAVERLKDLEIPYSKYYDDPEDVDGLTVIDLGGKKQRKHLFIGKIVSTAGPEEGSFSHSLIRNNPKECLEWMLQWSNYLEKVISEFKNEIDDVDGSMFGLRIIKVDGSRLRA